MLLVWHGGISKKVNRWFGMAVCMAVLVIFVITGLNGYAIAIGTGQEVYNRYSEGYDILYENPEYPIYYQGERIPVIQGIRTRATESILYFCEPGEDEENFFYVVTGKEYDILRENNPDYVFIAKLHEEYIFAKGQDIMESLNEKGIQITK